MTTECAICGKELEDMDKAYRLVPLIFEKPCYPFGGGFYYNWEQAIVIHRECSKKPVNIHELCGDKFEKEEKEREKKSGVRHWDTSRFPVEDENHD